MLLLIKNKNGVIWSESREECLPLPPAYVRFDETWIPAELFHHDNELTDNSQ